MTENIGLLSEKIGVNGIAYAVPVAVKFSAPEMSSTETSIRLPFFQKNIT